MNHHLGRALAAADDPGAIGQRVRRVSAGAGEPTELQPSAALAPVAFTPAQRQRLWANSPEHHKDATSCAGFERIVSLTERAHRIGVAPAPAIGPQREPLTREQLDVIYAATQDAVAKLEAEHRYSFGGWFPVAARLIEAAHGIGSPA